MREETKSVIYMALDILDSINSSSSDQGHHFIKVDNKILDDVRDELFQLLAGSVIEKNEMQISPDKKEKKNEREELIGLLPLVLIDKTKFPSNNDIIKLAEFSLNIQGLSKRKRSRNELIGIIVSEIAQKENNELDLFLKLWRKFMKNNTINKFDYNSSLSNDKLTIKNTYSNDNSIDNKESNFVDVWLEFFKFHKER
ncbi:MULTISPECIES: hypothetical protein [Bacillus cereus group]|nr:MULTISPECIES: hypothetical protein [Bacillus cereus group]CGG48047.1 Uncharacterised protein [Streptococcus pneumoniae]MDA2089778.1 hypothetical protein [Bacillus cereus]MDA2363092.1 hypothetical protein [Bacillus cereus]MDA2368166.1 hypothetical protein [Bacillus cereus]MDA2373441.1 hypothetical protein [Bacillus cereus]